MGPRTPALGPIILGTFRACGVNPTLKLTREQYTRNMAVWYIRNMAAWGVALLLFLLGYNHPIRQRRRWWRLPLQLQFSTLPFAPSNLDGPAREAVETDKHTQNRLRCSPFAPRDYGNRGLNWSPGEETAVGWNTKARKRMLPKEKVIRLMQCRQWRDRSSRGWSGGLGGIKRSHRRNKHTRNTT
jgi:hypothetical protein